jgi:sec-independent protein translocase protein TatB
MLSIPHLIIIFAVALVVFGPDKLPELARNLGKVMAEFKRATGDLRSTFEEHLRELERETTERRINSAPASSNTNPSGAVTSSNTPKYSPASVHNPVPAPKPPTLGSVSAVPPYLSRSGTSLPDESSKGEPERSASESPINPAETISDDRKEPT